MRFLITGIIVLIILFQACSKKQKPDLQKAMIAEKAAVLPDTNLKNTADSLANSIEFRIWKTECLLGIYWKDQGSKKKVQNIEPLRAIDPVYFTTISNDQPPE